MNGDGARLTRMKKKSNNEEQIGSYKIGAPDCPVELSDAGSAELFHINEQAKRIGFYRTAARRAFRSAQQKVSHARMQSEKYAREALDMGAKAYWLAEHTDLAEEEYRRLYKMGSWVRRIFGCKLTFADGRYVQRCPVAIASKRLGFSPGFTAVRWCSICDEDLSECPHMRDRLYWVRGGSRGSQRCPVCIEDGNCNHSPDRLYRASVVSIIKEVDELREVSIVNNPAQPFARLIEIPIDLEGLRQHLGSEFLVGMPVSCDRCLSPYPGLPPEVELNSNEN